MSTGGQLGRRRPSLSRRFLRRVIPRYVRELVSLYLPKTQRKLREDLNRQHSHAVGVELLAIDLDEHVRPLDRQVGEMTSTLAQVEEAAETSELVGLLGVRDELRTVRTYLAQHHDENAQRVEAFATMLDELASVSSGLGAVADGLASACGRFRAQLRDPH